MRLFTMVILFAALAACTRTGDENIIYLFKGEVTTVTQFRREYEAWLTAAGHPDSVEQRRTYLENRLMEEILYSKGKLEGIEYLPDIREKVDNYKRRLIVEKTRELVDRSLYPLDEETIKKYYAENRDRFVREKLHRLYAIRVKNKEQAFTAYAEIAERGGSIRLLSARYSDDKRLANMNGDWGLFSEEVMDDAWRKAVLDGRIGDIIGPVRDGDNYWTLIEIAGFAYKRELPFERAYPLILHELMQQGGTEKWREYRAKLLREYGVKLNLDNLHWE